jgi:hypothetical protein
MKVFIQAPYSPLRAVDWVAKLEASGVEVTLVDVHTATTNEKQRRYGAGIISIPTHIPNADLRALPGEMVYAMRVEM